MRFIILIYIYIYIYVLHYQDFSKEIRPTIVFRDKRARSRTLNAYCRTNFGDHLWVLCWIRDVV